MKKKKSWVFYVYVTRHGCYSETAILYVGYQEYRPPIYDNYSTWFSEPVNTTLRDEIYNKVHYLDGNETSDTSYPKKIINDYIKSSKNK